ncbi:hypothetical protein [Luteimonas sp. A478]
MTDASHLPLTLYNANLQLWLRIGQLLEDNRGQWMELLRRGLQDRLAEAGGEAARLQAGDWSALAMLPGSALWHLAERQASDMQALAQSASDHQATFVDGFQQALTEWQQTTTAALEDTTADTAHSAGPLDALRKVLDQLSEVMMPATTGPAVTATAPARKPARRTAARTTPAPEARPAAKAPRKAAKKAAKRAASKAVKKAAVKKAPARKKAAASKKAAAGKAPASKAVAKTAAKKTSARKAAKKTSRNGAAN